MDRQSVSSTNVASIGWQANDQTSGNGTLEVEFHSGALYQYYNVPQSVYQTLIGSVSLGAAIRTALRGYDYERL
jgi:hypothetical protein